MLKNLPVMQETCVLSLGQEDCLEEGMPTNSSILVWNPREFWQNVVHWRRKWQTTSALLPWEPHEQYEKTKRYDIENGLPRLVGAQYTTGEEWRITPERMKRWSQSKNNIQLWMWHDGNKVRCCKEQYCIGTWYVRFMNQGKLEVIKQDMARVNIDILGISELKCTALGEFNSDDHYIYYYGQESCRRNGVTLTVNRRVRNAVSKMTTLPTKVHLVKAKVFPVVMYGCES